MPAAAVLLILVVAQASAKSFEEFGPSDFYKTFSWTNPDTDKVSKYAISTTRLTWDDAEEYCQTVFNGHLAAPSTQAENDFLKWTFSILVHPKDIHMMWFGGFRYSTNPNSFYFTNGEETTRKAYVAGMSTTAPNGIAAQGDPEYSDYRYAAYGTKGQDYGWVMFPQPGPEWPFICEA